MCYAIAGLDTAIPLYNRILQGECESNPKAFFKAQGEAFHKLASTVSREAQNYENQVRRFLRLK